MKVVGGGIGIYKIMFVQLEPVNFLMHLHVSLIPYFQKENNYNTDVEPEQALSWLKRSLAIFPTTTPRRNGV